MALPVAVASAEMRELPACPLLLITEYHSITSLLIDGCCFGSSILPTPGYTKICSTQPIFSSTRQQWKFTLWLSTKEQNGLTILEVLDHLQHSSVILSYLAHGSMEEYIQFTSFSCRIRPLWHGIKL